MFLGDYIAPRPLLGIVYVSLCIVLYMFRLYVTPIVLFYINSIGFLLVFRECSRNIPLIDQSSSRKYSLIDHLFILLT